MPEKLFRIQDAVKSPGAMTYDKLADVIQDCLDRYELCTEHDPVVLEKAKSALSQMRFIRGDE